MTRKAVGLQRDAQAQVRIAALGRVEDDAVRARNGHVGVARPEVCRLQGSA
jgi:hypothetical protein